MQITSEATKKKAGRRWFWFFLIILAVTALSYANSLQNQHVFDDLLLIAENRELSGIENIPHHLLSGRILAYYRPMRAISYALDYTLNREFWHRFARHQWHHRGLVPLGYHVSNVFYHMVTAVLVYLVICQLSLSARAAFIGATLFALHPVHTESVTYISGRRDILVTLFYLAGFYFFLRYRLTKRLLSIAAAFLMYLLSLGSKEMGVTLPGLFIAYDLAKNFRHSESSISSGYWKALFASAKKSFMQSSVLYSLAFLGFAAYSCYKVFLKSPSLQSAYYGDSTVTTFLTVGRILVHYIKLLVFPIRLNADYSYNAFPLSVSWYDPSTFASFVALLLLGYLALKLMVTHKKIAFGIAWFFITLLPVCHIIPHHELLAEHYLYLPSVGFCLVAALTAERAMAAGRHTVLLTACFFAVVALFSFRIWDRNKDWSDSLTLYQKTITTAPQCARAHNNLGNALAKEGRLEEAVSAYERALAIKPSYTDARNNLGIVYARNGDVDGAITEYKKVLRLTPNHTRAHYNLANAYRKKGLLDQAVAAYEKALEIKPNHLWARRNLMEAQAEKKAQDQKIITYEQALAASPADAALHNNLGELYGRKGMVEQSVFHYRQAMAIEPDYAPAYNNLAWVYATSIHEAHRNGREAVRLATKACELTGYENAGMLDTLAAACAEAGDFKSAVAYQEKALALSQGKEQADLRVRLRHYEAGQPYRSY